MRFWDGVLDLLGWYPWRCIGKYVVLTDEDFRRANVEATQTVEIVKFVEASEIAPLYFETPYYLAPQKRGEKDYALPSSRPLFFPSAEYHQIAAGTWTR
jgi:hypothetical protein